MHCILLKFIKPDFSFEKLSDLNLAEVERIKHEFGIEAIILDVDETLRTKAGKIPKINKQWFKSLHGKVKIIILSNGFDRGIAEYFSKRKIDYIGFAFKPFRGNFVKACQKLKVKPENVMMVGDSVLADIFGAKRNNMKTALIKSVDTDKAK